MSEKLTKYQNLPLFEITFGPNFEFILNRVENKPIKPESLPFLREVYDQKKSSERIKFNPFTGEIYILGSFSENSKLVEFISFDDLNDLEKSEQIKSGWFIFKNIDTAYSFYKNMLLFQNKRKVVDDTESLVFSISNFLPLIYEDKLNGRTVRNLFTNAYNQLTKPSDNSAPILETNDAEFSTNLEKLISIWREIRKHQNTDFLKKSHLTSVFLDILVEMGKGKFSPILVQLLAEREIEKIRSDKILNIIKQSKNINNQNDLLSMLNSLKNEFDFNFFRVAPFRNFIALASTLIFGINEENIEMIKQLLGEDKFRELIDDLEKHGNGKPISLIEYIKNNSTISYWYPEIKNRIDTILNKISSGLER
jgi:hypothetical protein